MMIAITRNNVMAKDKKIPRHRSVKDSSLAQDGYSQESLKGFIRDRDIKPTRDTAPPPDPKKKG